MKSLIITIFLFSTFMNNISGQIVFQKDLQATCKKIPIADTISLIKKTKKIEIINFENPVEFKDGRPVDIGIKERGIVIWDWDNNIPNKTYWNHEKIKRKSKYLNESERKLLFEILYGYEKEYYHEKRYNEFCSYSPRNGIIFYGEDDKVLGYFEICFECDIFRLTPKIYFGADMCSDKIKYLKNFFDSVFPKSK